MIGLVGIIFSEKRRFKRLEVNLPVHLCVVETAPLRPVTKSIIGNLCDLTPGGARIEVNSVIINGLHLFYDVNNHPYRRLELTLEMPDNGGKISFQGRISWYDRKEGSSRFNCTFGVELIDITPEERERLYNFLFNIKRASKNG
ncbi:MAG: PilZ domain-containing protein [Thermodesulfobacteriota bacterium]